MTDHERYTAYWIGWLRSDVRALPMPESTRETLLADVAKLEAAQKNEIDDGVLSYARPQELKGAQ
jgi:hypothetical protein